MTRRILASIFVLWVLGFFWFGVSLPGPAGAQETDAIVVPTGGSGRIDRGLELLRAGKAKRMLVTGVGSKVKPREFEVEYKVPREVMRCCVSLGFAAEDTKGNATETAAWIARHKYRSLRLVTTDWHMRRAANELRSALPSDIEIVEDAVPSQPSFRILLLEYHKYVASLLSRLAFW